VAKTVEAKLAALRGDPKSDDVLAALRSTTGLLVAAATKHAERLGLLDELAPAFTRLLDSAAKRDPGCRGKTAIARLLHDLDRWEDAVFIRGASCVQLEPAMGGPVDTAAELRGICGLAHAHFGRDDALDVLAKLLADPERTARAAAATGLGDAGHIDASALLRFKLLVGDEASEVLSACFESLFDLTRERALAFAVELAAARDDRGELAVLALGTSKLAGAEDAIVAWCETCSPDQRRRVGYLALALTRSEPSLARLLGIVRGEDTYDAIAAARALATFKDDPTVRTRLADAARDAERAVRTEIEKLTS
jgi:hypothetical protein